MTDPLISVLMTSYNRGEYVAEAIGSVLASYYPHFELIIVDDGSKDDTVRIAGDWAAKDSRIKVYVNEKNLGDYPNRNRAASYATGKYIKYLDSDDIMYPHCLQVMVNGMELYPDAGLGLCSVPDKKKIYPVRLAPRNIYLEHFGGFGHFDRAPGSAIILRSAFESVGRFTGERMIGDYQLWLKMSMTYPLVKLPRDLVWDRQHSGQESKSDYARDYDRLKRNALTDALQHADCPLDKTEREAILASLNHSRLKKKLKTLIGK
jgi:glycosyltransferase involved in cell wall biosynthesis